MICFLYGVWFNIRYFNEFFARGFVASGHEYSKEGFVIHQDHWHIFCKRCGSMAATEVHPNKIKEHSNGARSR